MIRNKINILFVLIQVNQGGTERVVIDLIRSLNPSKYNSYLAYFEEGELTCEFNKICNKTYHIPKRRGIDLSTMLGLSQIIKKHDIDVVNAHHYMPYFYSFIGSKIFNKRKLIYVEHSVHEVKAILTSHHRRIFRELLRHTDTVVGISNEIGATFHNSYPKYKDKFQVIINGVDVDRFNVCIDRDKLRSHWGISPNHFVVGTVANFRKVKNHVCLIRAIRRVNESNPNIRIMLVGQAFPGDQESSERELVDLINDCGLEEKVIMAGYQNNIEEILKAFDVFCLPSLSEGLPVCVLEAMAAKVPVVGSNVQGINEVVFHENTGILFTSNDDTELAYAIERLFKDNTLRSKIAINAFNHVKKEHGLKEWVLKYEKLFGAL